MKSFLRYLILIFLISYNNLSPIVFIITIADNHPEFIKMQYNTFKRFLKDDYEYIVFNDAIDPKLENDINLISHNLKIRCFRVNQEIHKCIIPLDIAHFLNSKTYSFTPSFRHGDSIHFAFHTLGFAHNDIIAIIGSGMFLVNDFSIRKYLGNYHIASLKRNNLPSPEFAIFNIPILPYPKAMIFKSGTLNTTFVPIFGFLEYYFKANPSVKFKEMEYIKFKDLINIPQETLLKMNFSKDQKELISSYLINFFEKNSKFKKKYLESDKSGLLEKTFLHLSDEIKNEDYVQLKVDLYKSYITKLIN